MWKYLLKRFLLMLPTILGVAIVTFLLIRVIPGDVVELRYSGDRGAVSQELLDKERAWAGGKGRAEVLARKEVVRGWDGGGQNKLWRQQQAGW